MSSIASTKPKRVSATPKKLHHEPSSPKSSDDESDSFKDSESQVSDSLDHLVSTNSPLKSHSKTKRSSSSSKISKPKSKSRNFNDIFESVKNQGSLVMTVNAWLASYSQNEQNRIASISSLIDFVMHSGCIEEKVNPNVVQENKSASTEKHLKVLVNQTITSHKKTGSEDEPEAPVPEVPLDSKDKQFKMFPSSYAQFWKTLMDRGSDSVVLDGFFLPRLLMWLLTMSASNFYPIRLASTAAAYHICDGLLSMSKDLKAQLEKIEKQTSSEATNRSKKLPERLKEEKARIQARLELIDRFVDVIWNQFFTRRWSDTRAEVRSLCIKAFPDWLLSMPSFFSHASRLKYLSWMMSDLETPIRAKACKEWLNIFKHKHLFLPELKSACQATWPRLESLLAEEHTQIVVTGIQIIDEIRKTWRGIVTPQIMSIIRTSICADTPFVRNAAAAVLLYDFTRPEEEVEAEEEEVEDETTESTSMDVDDEKSDDNALLQSGKTESVRRKTKEIQQRKKERRAALAREANLDSKNKIALRRLIDFVEDTSFHHNMVHYIVDSMWDMKEAKFLHDFEAQVEMLQSLERSSSSSNKHASGSISRASALSLLITSCIRKAHGISSVHSKKSLEAKGKKSTEPSDELLEPRNKIANLPPAIQKLVQEFTRLMTKHLPSLISNFRTDDSTLINLLELPRYFDFSMVVTLREGKTNYTSLLQTMKNVFVSSTNAEVMHQVVESFDAMMDTVDSADGETTTTLMADSLIENIDELVSYMKSLADDSGPIANKKKAAKSNSFSDGKAAGTAPLVLCLQRLLALSKRFDIGRQNSIFLRNVMDIIVMRSAGKNHVVGPTAAALAIELATTLIVFRLHGYCVPRKSDSVNGSTVNKGEPEMNGDEVDNPRASLKKLESHLSNLDSDSNPKGKSTTTDSKSKKKKKTTKKKSKKIKDKHHKEDSGKIGLSEDESEEDEGSEEEDNINTSIDEMDDGTSSLNQSVLNNLRLSPKTPTQKEIDQLKANLMELISELEPLMSVENDESDVDDLVPFASWRALAYLYSQFSQVLNVYDLEQLALYCTEEQAQSLTKYFEYEMTRKQVVDPVKEMQKSRKRDKNSSSKSKNVDDNIEADENDDDDGYISPNDSIMGGAGSSILHRQVPPSGLAYYIQFPSTWNRKEEMVGMFAILTLKNILGNHSFEQYAPHWICHFVSHGKRIENFIKRLLILVKDAFVQNPPGYGKLLADCLIKLWTAYVKSKTGEERTGDHEELQIEKSPSTSSLQLTDREMETTSGGKEEGYSLRSPSSKAKTVTQKKKNIAKASAFPRLTSIEGVIQGELGPQLDTLFAFARRIGLTLFSPLKNKAGQFLSTARLTVLELCIEYFLDAPSERHYFLAITGQCIIRNIPKHSAESMIDYLTNESLHTARRISVLDSDDKILFDSAIMQLLKSKIGLKKEKARIGADESTTEEESASEDHPPKKGAKKSGKKSQPVHNMDEEELDEEEEEEDGHEDEDSQNKIEVSLKATQTSKSKFKKREAFKRQTPSHHKKDELETEDDEKSPQSNAKKRKRVSTSVEDQLEEYELPETRAKRLSMEMPPPPARKPSKVRNTQESDLSSDTSMIVDESPQAKAKANKSITRTSPSRSSQARSYSQTSDKKEEMEADFDGAELLEPQSSRPKRPRSSISNTSASITFSPSSQKVRISSLEEEMDASPTTKRKKTKETQEAEVQEEEIRDSQVSLGDSLAGSQPIPKSPQSSQKKNQKGKK